MHQCKRGFLQGLLFLVLAQIMVGVSIVFSKYVLASLPVLFVLTIRFSLATLILLPLHGLSSASKEHSLSFYFSQLTSRDWFFIIAQGLCAGILFNFFMLWGLDYTDANVAGIITSALPAIIALMSWLILGEKISGKKLICVLFASLGLVVIACDKLSGSMVSTSGSASHSFFGDSMVLLALLPEATYYILCKMHSNALPVFLISALLNGLNAVLLWIVLIFSSWAGFHLPSTMEWIILIILGLSAGLFYVFWYFGYKQVDGVMASLSTAIMPVATVLIAWLFLGEQLSLGQGAGMLMILFSIAIYAKR